MNATFLPASAGTVIIGGGQAGLATAYHLRRLGEHCLVLDAEAHVGDQWRRRWDSLRLFTPARFSSLPGLPLPLAPGDYATKDEVAEYLAGYMEHFGLSVRSGVRVQRMTRGDGAFRVETDAGVVAAERVVVATGTNPVPRVPECAAGLSPEIRQLHSSQYRNPAQIPHGEVLVVGCGTSGVEIALELAEHHRTSIAGRPTPHIPDAVFRYGGGPYWWLLEHLLTVGTPVGRKAQPKVQRGGAPLIRISVKDLDRAGVARLPRVAGVTGGWPRIEDERVVEAAAVVWATGFRPDFGWIELPFTQPNGWPAGERGVCGAVPGLYFVGMPFQYGLTSGLIGGVGRDAEYVARHIVGAARAAEPVAA